MTVVLFLRAAWVFLFRCWIADSCFASVAPPERVPSSNVLPLGKRRASRDTVYEALVATDTSFLTKYSKESEIKTGTLAKSPSLTNWSGIRKVKGVLEEDLGRLEKTGKQESSSL